MTMIVIYALFGALAGAGYLLLQGEEWSMILTRGVPIGAIIAGSIAAFEVWVVGRPPRRWFVSLPAFAALVLRSAVYSMVIATALIGVITTLASDADGYALSAQFWADMAFSFAATMIFNTINLMQELVGGRKLLNVLIGRYHRPRRETRMFLFIDMKNSTALAEQLGDIAFHEFLAEFCEDVGRALIGHGGEIDRYIGDEIVATWWLDERGRHAGSVYRAVAAARATLRARADSYRARHGAVPDFRAGLHCGTVVAGEIGVGRREIGFVGDVINTTARIEQACRAVGEDILVSDALARLAPPPPDLFQAVSLPPMPLRGKSTPVGLTALRPATGAG